MHTLTHASDKARLFSLILLLAACAPSHAAPAEPQQARESYATAVRDQSTSPAWVLITLADDGEHASAKLCTHGAFLIGAIMRETDVGVAQARQLALDNQDHVFHFTKPAALDNLPRRYSEFDLANARALLAPLSTPELQHAFSSLIERPLLVPNKLPRAAIACALLERGLSPRTADISGQIYVEPLRPRAGTPPAPTADY
ncbi:MAG: hypothetical protein QFF03_18440 [Pseudomonadota bacterium]|nr:hypothetical protein [Pseudomonadota bacterium]